MRTFRYVLHHKVPDMVLMGWIAHPALNGTTHGEWAVLMEWLCDCKAVEVRY